MKTLKWLGAGALTTSLIVALAWTPVQAVPQENKAPTESDAQVFLNKYAALFNTHDAKALAENWAPQAVSINSETGRRVEGRDAIREDFDATFKANPKSKLSLQLKRQRLIKPDLLSISGELTVTGLENDEEVSSSFSVLLSKQGNAWLIEEATESPLPAPETASDALKDLAWFVGNWKDDVEGMNVTSEVKWSDKQNFLLRKFTVDIAEDNSSESGTQIITWDPRSKTIRSWTFCTDGSFGEGTYSQTGNGEWKSKFTHTQADGSLLTGQQILTRIDADTIQVQILGLEEDGEMQANGPAVKMIRQPATPTEKK